MNQEEKGRFYRDAWVASVQQHYPGVPKSSYVMLWEEMPEWEQQAAIATYEQVHQFVHLTHGGTQRLTKEQKGRFMRLCWIGQVYCHFATPKESHIADWEQVPTWLHETDTSTFEAIEQAVLQEMKDAT